MTTTEQQQRITVKALEGGASGDWIVDVRAAPFGSPSMKDGQGEFFTPRTQFREDKYGLPPVVYYHGFDDTNNPAQEPRYIGKAVDVENRSDGRWYRVVLDKSVDMAKRVWGAAQKGTAMCSPGSVNYLTRVLKTGEITEWPINEISLFETETGKIPASKHAVAVPVLKAIYDRAGMDLPIPQEADSDDTTETGTADATAYGDVSSDGGSETEALINKDNLMAEEQVTISPDMQALVNQQVADALKAQLEQQEAQRKAEEEIQKEVDARVKAETEKLEAEYAKKSVLPFTAENAPYQSKFGELWAYDNYPAEDIAFMIQTLKSGARKGLTSGPDNRPVGQPSENAYKALAVRFAESKDEHHLWGKQAMLKANLPLKANELMQSTYAGYGDEWVTSGYSQMLWRDVEQVTNVVQNLPKMIVPQGQESIVIPIESTHPVVYKVAQASAQTSNLGRPTGVVTSSKAGTGQRTLSVAKVGAQTVYTGEMVEDAMIDFVAEIRREMVLEMAYAMDDIAINGDTATTASTNINDIAGTPAGTESFLAFDGFRKLALVTNTANSRAGGVLTAEDFLETLKLLGLAGRNALDPRYVSFIIDLWTGWKAMELDDLKSKDHYTSPVLNEGMIRGIYGYPVLHNAFVHRANTDATYGLKCNSDGKCDLDTNTNNTYGAILAVRWDQWRFGVKRNVTLETERFPDADANTLVAMARVGMNYRDTDAAAISRVEV